MSNNNKGEGTGKQQPQRVFVERTWVTGDTCVQTITDPQSKAYVKAGLFDMRTKFINRLREEGFEITHYNGSLPEDTIYLTMNPQRFTVQQYHMFGKKSLIEE